MRIFRAVPLLASSVLLTGALSAATMSADARETTAGARGQVAAAPAARRTAEEIRAYWTPARMRAAVPVEQLVDGLALGRATAPSSTTTRTTQDVRAPRSTGKLFFKVDGLDAVCTASAINTRKRNQVITAGHCVHTGPNVGLLQQPHFYSDWVYVPRYRNGKAPYGTWVADNAYAFQGWVEREAFRFDQAILTLEPHGRRQVVDVTGGNDVVWGKRQREWGVRIWGWPAEEPYDGETAKRCDGRTVRFKETADAAMHACDLTGGASGGPWLLPRGRTANSGRIWAITSRRMLDRPVLLARPIPREIRRMIRSANR